MWFWINNPAGGGDKPPLTPQDAFTALIDIACVYYAARWLSDIISQFVDVIFELLYHTGRFGHLHW